MRIHARILEPISVYNVEGQRAAPARPSAVDTLETLGLESDQGLNIGGQSRLMGVWLVIER